MKLPRNQGGFFLLAPEEREILVLKYFNELSIKEIAAATECPAGNSEIRLFRARKNTCFTATF